MSATAGNGVVDAGTRLVLTQRGTRIFGRYRGGSIRRGVLAGRIAGGKLTFRYLQRESSGEFHGGDSRCEIERSTDGRVRIVEQFTWRTRDGSGTNVFEEIAHA